MKKHIKNTHKKHTEAHYTTKTIKVMVMFIFFSLILLGGVSAITLTDWNDKLTYSNNDLKISLDNWWGLGKTIGTAELKSHNSVDERRSVSIGESVVMWYDFDFIDLYENGLGDVEIINVDTGEIIQRNYTFVYLGNETYQVPNYVCNDVSVENGTIKECQESGTKNKTRETWLPHNSRDIPKGKITIGLELNMLMDETIDIVWKIGGKKIEKHAVVSSGAIETIDGDFTIFTFSNNGTLNITTSSVNISVLVVAGGGGGGSDEGTGSGGGGGAGGLLFNGSKLLAVGNFNIIVGVGGDSGTTGNGFNGQNSSFDDMITFGGGGGGFFEFSGGDDGQDGGSGGGGGQRATSGTLQLGGTGVVGQGNDGGNSGASNLVAAGGGGGASVVGQNVPGSGLGGDGGNGTQFSINGTLIVYSCGGGGGGSTRGEAGCSSGGIGTSSSVRGTAGLNGTGGGGGGGRNNDDAQPGGSGVVIIKILTFDLIDAPTINLDSPVNNTNFTLTNNVTFNATIFDDTNITNVTLYIDDLINATNTTAGLNNTLWTFNVVGFAEGDTDWTMESCNFNNECGNATARTFNINTTPDIQYGAGVPINEFNTTNDFFDVNVTITENLFQNITFDLYNVNGALNQTVTFTNSSRNQNWTNLLDGDYSYNVTVATSTNQFNSTETRNITLESTHPAVEILAPPTIVSFHEINTNLFVNWSVNDINLDTCILEYEGVNTTLTCLDNTTSINITTILNRTLTIYVNDTFGNTNFSSRSWEYTIFQSSLTFNAETIGGNTEDFELNITKDSSLSISTVNLIYNESSSSASFTLGDDSTITASLDVPNPSADTNFSFFFSFTMSDAQIINTTSNNQSVLNFGIGNCSTFSTLIYNFTMLDEENQTELSNVTIDYAFNLFDDSRETLITNFSESSTVNPTAVCINQNLTTSSFSLDAILKYVSGNGTYLPRFHNILNFSLTNSTIPNNIDLFDVLDTTATPFQITFRDSLLVEAPNILVNVNKQFIASNDFKTVEIPITDTNGQAILNLVRDTAIYNLVFIDIEGNIVATFSQISAFCQDATIGQCTLELDSSSTVPQTFNLSKSNKISFTIDYTNSTSTATLNFNSINSTAVNVRFVGTTQNQFGNRSVCDNSLTSTLGTINCDASGILTSDNFLFLDVFSDDKYISTTIININTANPLVGGIYGGSGYFIAFLMLLTIIILFSEDKQALLVMLGLGWATVLIFGLVKGTIIGSISGGIWLIVSIATMIWKLKQEEVGT